MTSTPSDTISSSTTSMTDMVKEALALKKSKLSLQENKSVSGKNYRIGMPPKGTRRAMGKR